MSSSLQYNVEKTNPDENVFRVKFEVIDGENISLNVFVFDTEHQDFLHVATTYDLHSWPASRQEAIEANKPFYRTRAFTKNFDNIDSAINMDTVTRARLLVLVKSWDKDIDSFTGTDTVSISSS